MVEEEEEEEEEKEDKESAVATIGPNCLFSLASLSLSLSRLSSLYLSVRLSFSLQGAARAPLLPPPPPAAAAAVAVVVAVV